MDEKETSPWFNAVEWAVFEYTEMPDPVSTGFTNIDRLHLGGLVPGLHMLMGEPGAGKSAISIQMAVRCSMQGCGAAIVSLEMMPQETWLRAASLWSCYDRAMSFNWSDARSAARGLRGLTIDERSGVDSVLHASRGMAELPLYISHPESPDVESITGLMEDASKMGVRLVVIDYLQLVSAPGEREHERVGAAVNALAATAIQNSQAVVCISAMNRDSLKGPASMHSGAGSSLIEYAAQSVSLIYRDHEDPRVTNGGTYVHMKVFKNRNGMVTDEPLTFVYYPKCNLFQEQ